MFGIASLISRPQPDGSEWERSGHSGSAAKPSLPFGLTHPASPARIAYGRMGSETMELCHAAACGGGADGLGGLPE